MKNAGGIKTFCPGRIWFRAHAFDKSYRDKIVHLMLYQIDLNH